MRCLDCDGRIPFERMEILPETEYCTTCACKHEKPFVARMIYNHKTAGEVIIARGKENVRLLNREYTRAR